MYVLCTSSYCDRRSDKDLQINNIRVRFTYTRVRTRTSQYRVYAQLVCIPSYAYFTTLEQQYAKYYELILLQYYKEYELQYTPLYFSSYHVSVRLPRTGNMARTKVQAGVCIATVCIHNRAVFIGTNTTRVVYT